MALSCPRPAAPSSYAASCACHDRAAILTSALSHSLGLCLCLSLPASIEPSTHRGCARRRSALRVCARAPKAHDRPQPHSAAPPKRLNHPPAVYRAVAMCACGRTMPLWSRASSVMLRRLSSARAIASIPTTTSRFVRAPPWPAIFPGRVRHAASLAMAACGRRTVPYLGLRCG